MHLPQKTLLKSCRNATLGRDRTLVPNVTPLARIVPALTQNESIGHNDTLEPLGCDPPTNCVTESGLWCGAAWLGGVTPVPKSHAPLWGMKIVRRYRMYNIHRVPLQPPQKCKKGIMDQTPSITTVSYEEEWSRPAVQLERGQGNKSSRGVQTGCVVTRLFPTHAQECRSFAGHQWPRLGSKARVPQTKETRAKTPGLGSLGFRISGLDQAQKKARKP